MVDAAVGGQAVAPGVCSLVEEADGGSTLAQQGVHEDGVGVRVGVDVEGGGRVLRVAVEEVGAPLADGAEVVDGEGAEGGVLVEECFEGLVSRNGDLGVLVRVAVAYKLAPFPCAVRMQTIYFGSARCGGGGVGLVGDERDVKAK